MFTQNREEIRRFYLQSWEKQQQGRPLEPLEAQIVDIIVAHPEYHPLLNGGEDGLEREWTPEMGESNPFLHMGMHLAIREQLSTDRPPGIRAATQRLLKQIGDGHATEHQMMECLGEALWKGQRAGTTADEQAYLRCVKKLGN
ncbi:MAG: DUF1841 family protein [Gammaproteobacteria bacterium]|nr:DUF1841 family protein [Gammaproteobacteria bacterium]MBT7306960.1 DUF1841 family protein [Gammaproteobacteria bacterium]